MQEQHNPSTYNDPIEEDFSFRRQIQKRKKDLVYLWGFRYQLILVLLLGTVLGAIIAWKWPVSYTARLSFVVEESKAGGGSLVSALAGQFGFDIGSMSGSNGVLAGDNVQELLRSRKLIKRTLLTPYQDNPHYSLADRYAEAYNLKSQWKKHSGGKIIGFPSDEKNYTRLQDSLLQVMILRINEKELSVSKPDKKLSFFELNTTMRDENLSHLFCSRLIKEATDFYIKTKTQRLRTNVDRLQVRADSLEKVLNRKTYSVSAANRILLDANPAYPSSNAGVELQQRDKIALSTIYSEVVKNLEVSRTMLIQETPTFQVVDEPQLPLKKNRLGYVKSIVLTTFGLLAMACIFLLLFRK